MSATAPAAGSEAKGTEATGTEAKGTEAKGTEAKGTEAKGTEGQQAQGAQLPKWLSELNDPNLAADPTLTRFADTGTLAKSYVELNKKIGQKGLIPPGKDAKPEEVKAFWKELGAGEKAEDYKLPEGFAIPEGLPIDEQFIGAMAAVCADANVPKSAWDKLVQGYVAFQAAEFEKVKGLFQTSKEQGLAALRAAWGNAFDAKLQGATKALEHVFAKEFDSVRRLVLADGTPLGNHPLFLRAFADLADQMGEAKMVPGLAPRTAMTREEAEREIRRLEANPEWMKAWNDGAHPEHKDAVERRRALYEIATGSAAASGSAQVGTPIQGGGFVRG